MITLKEIAAMADDVLLTDAYSSSTFYAQFELFNDSTRSGPATARRVISTAPDVTVPSRRTVYESASGYYWLLGGARYDYFQGAPIRIKYPVLLAKGGQAVLRTIPQILAASGGTTDARIDISYLKRIITESTGYFEAGYNVTYPSYYTLSAGDVVYHDSIYYLVREDGRLDDVGLMTAELARLDSPIKTMSYQGYTGTYNPTTDSKTVSTPKSVSVFTLDHSFDFLRTALGFPKLEDGDLSGYVLKSAVTTVLPNDKFDSYRVLAVYDKSTAWNVHLRVG